jgi:hypothetical protein
MSTTAGTRMVPQPPGGKEQAGGLSLRSAHLPDVPGVTSGGQTMDLHGRNPALEVTDAAMRRQEVT